jgi:acyl-homoserine-lactone acylase
MSKCKYAIGIQARLTVFRINYAKNLVAIIILILTVNCSAGTKEKGTEILWDTYGVPHIYADNPADMYYAFGKAQMNNHAKLILKLYAQARGKAASYLGRDYLESDKLINLFRINELAEANYKKQEIEYKSYIDAFVRGINDYVKENPGSIPDEFRKILPVTAFDVTAHTLRVICIEFLAMDDLGTVKRLTEAGSNAIAISPSKSVSGNAMLLTNPHLPWSDFFTWFEAHLNTTDFNIYGIALVGMPSVTMAFSENLGWAHTVNPIDASDRYELNLDGDGYIFDNKTVPFIKRKVSIDVLEQDGSVKSETFDFKYSEHGPVVGEKGKKAWAVRVAGLNNTSVFEQYHKMGKAHNLEEFESALKMLQNPMFNVVYADRDGNILYLFNGNVPVRKNGDISFWRGTVDGTRSDLIWNEYHSYETLPKVINPTSGFLQNCNDPPWNCTFPSVLDADNFPSYMAPRGMGLRPQRAVNLIRLHDKLTFDDLVDIKLNTGIESADRFLDELLAAAEKSSDQNVKDAVKVLKAWDRKADSDSKGALLFAAWWDQVNFSLFKIPWSPDHPVTTPSGLRDPDKAVELLARAAENTIKMYGALDVKFGDIFRLRNNKFDYPSNGGSEHYGILRAIYYAGDSDGKMRAVAGDTYYAVTEFGKKVHSMVLLSYGNSTQSGNKHMGDQLKMMSEKKMRPALYYREDVEKNIEKRELVYSGSLGKNDK